MKRKSLSRNVLCTGLVAFGMVAALYGCGDSDGKSIENTQSDEAITPTSDEIQRGDSKGREYLPFRIAFKADGTPVILDEKGNPEIWERAKLPLQTKALLDLRTFSIATVQGSCTVVYTDSNGGLVQKTYPSAYCKYKGIPEN